MALFLGIICVCDVFLDSPFIFGLRGDLVGADNPAL